jgi:Ca-activated chloride channel homolog
MLNREDFKNDKVDAGEIGSGHTVTAIYEVRFKGARGQLIDPLRYGAASEATGNKGSEYAFVNIRYKLPKESASKLISQPVTAANEVPSTEASFAAAVAGFGQLLRGGQYTEKFSYDDVIALAQANKGKDDFGYRAEFINLVRIAKTAAAMEKLQ